MNWKDRSEKSVNVRIAFAMDKFKDDTSVFVSEFICLNSRDKLLYQEENNMVFDDTYRQPKIYNTPVLFFDLPYSFYTCTTQHMDYNCEIF